MKKKRITRIEADRRFVILSLESGHWVVSAIWDDVRVFRAIEDLRVDSKRYGDSKARFEVVYEDEFFSGKEFALLKPPVNIDKLLVELDEKRRNKPVEALTEPAPTAVPDFDKWLTGQG